MQRNFHSLSFLAGDTPQAQEAGRTLSALYGNERPEDAAIVVALGGDGFMLHVLHRFMGTGKPIYGMNKGTIGFLMNEYREEGLRERLAAAVENEIRPLSMVAVDAAGASHESLAINEVAIFRQSYQAARLQISAARSCPTTRRSRSLRWSRRSAQSTPSPTRPR